MALGFRRLTASVLIVSFALLPPALLAKERHGANLVIKLKDGRLVKGELIAFKRDSLLMLSSAGDESVGFAEMSSVKIVRKSHAGTGFLLGFVGGAIVGGLYGYGLTDSVEIDRTTLPMRGALIFGAIGGILGLAIGTATGEGMTIELENLSERGVRDALSRLRGMARMRDAG